MTIVKKVMGLMGLMGLIGPMGLMGLIGPIGLMGCSSDDAESPAPQEQCAVGFAATFAENDEEGTARRSQSRETTDQSGYATARMTRAVGDGELTNALLQEMGFGVYCWYTGTNNFVSPKTVGTTILMMNQKVEYTNSIWTYTPSKYWPLKDNEKLTFRAYAPYTNYLYTDASGMPQLPVVVKANDYQNGTQHDPLWGTSKHGGTDDEEKTYGMLYDNYTYTMSGDTHSSDSHDGTIDWFFHHGMSRLMFTCSIIKDPGCSKITIKSIKVNDLYTQGLLSISSTTTSDSDKPTWTQSGGDMEVEIGTDYLISNPLEIITSTAAATTPVNLLSKGLLIIPRNFGVTPMDIEISYTIDADPTVLTAKGTIGENFCGNTSYTIGLSLTPSTKGLEITVVHSAFTEWLPGGAGDHTVYNW